VLDEVQLVDDFVEVLLSLMHKRHLDVYVSGSNSKFLSKDVVTEFRGRGDEIRVWPLSFKEYFEVVGGDRFQAWNEYYTYGGLPQVVQFESAAKKMEYLLNLYELTYLHDVIERNHLRNPEGLSQLTQILASTIGTSTNPKRISNTFQSVEGTTIISKTIKEYISYLQDAFLIEEALRYDVKGRKYIGTEMKYYFTDMGLRAAALNFRQQEETHIMENIIYNELRSRGYRVDVGLVETWERDSQGKAVRKRLEVDFVVNHGPERVYIQSAFRMPTSEKESQEQRPLLGINDNFRKMIVVGDNIMRKVNDKGIVTMSLLDFLLDPGSVSSLFGK
jgi:predicted AAA+ superfamily ATPase